MSEGDGLDLSGLLDRVLDGGSLSEDEAGSLLRRLASDGVEGAYGGALLAGLRSKGETAEEIRGFANAMRELADGAGFDVPGDACDVVGTGGDGAKTYNLSTGGALLAAAAGVRVVKHGNRSVSSRSGAADLLECLGMAMPMEAGARGALFDRTGFAFLYAPAHHRAAARIGPMRKAMGVRTIFNVLGPLTNPARPGFGVIGAYSARTAGLMAEALSGMGVERVFVVHGEPGWDEATPVGRYRLWDVRGGGVEESERDPADVGLARCAASSLRGGEAAENCAALRRVFDGERGAHRDAVCLAAALAIEVVGLEGEPGAALERAAGAIDDGSAGRVLDAIGEMGGGSGG